MWAALDDSHPQQMLDSLISVREQTGAVWSLFGTFSLNVHLQRMLCCAAARSEVGKRYNWCMAAVSISIEQAFAEVLNR